MMGGASQVRESVVMHGYGVPTLPRELQSLEGIMMRKYNAVGRGGSRTHLYSCTLENVH